jgi:hypothetical protein
MRISDYVWPGVQARTRMDLSTARVSKHVAHVEQRLGVRLGRATAPSVGSSTDLRCLGERNRGLFDQVFLPTNRLQPPHFHENVG